MRGYRSVSVLSQLLPGCLRQTPPSQPASIRARPRPPAQTSALENGLASRGRTTPGGEQRQGIRREGQGLRRLCLRLPSQGQHLLPPRPQRPSPGHRQVLFGGLWEWRAKKKSTGQVSEKRLIFLFRERPVLAFPCWGTGNSSRLLMKPRASRSTPTTPRGL